MHFHPAQLANCRSWVHPDKQVVVLIFHSGGSTPLQEMMTYSRSKLDLKRHRNTPEILVWRYFLLPEVLQPWLKSVKTNNYNKDTSQFPIVLIQRSVLCFQITFKCNIVTLWAKNCFTVAQNSLQNPNLLLGVIRAQKLMHAFFRVPPLRLQWRGVSFSGSSHWPWPRLRL